MTKSEQAFNAAEQLRSVELELLRRNAHVMPSTRFSRHRESFEMLDLLRRWGQDDVVQLAGVLYRAYDPTGSTVALFNRNERDLVRALIGTAAEDLVYHSSFSFDRGADEPPSPEAAENLAVLALAAMAMT